MPYLNPTAIIIPVHNRQTITLNCLNHLQSTCQWPMDQVIVVDDGSTDGTSEEVIRQYPQVTVLTGDGNLWWTGAIRQGMIHALAQGAKYLFWLNDDCLPGPETLAEMLAYMIKQPKTIVAAMALGEDDAQPLAIGFRGRQPIAGCAGKVIPVDGVSGYCVGIPATVVQKIGLPDAVRFPHYGGDSMYTLRATRSGFSVCILGTVSVTLPGISDSLYQLLAYLQAHAPVSGRSLFWVKKSPFYLPAQFHYHLEKFGIGIGLPVFSFKVLRWLVLWLRYRLDSFFQPQQPSQRHE